MPDPLTTVEQFSELFRGNTIARDNDWGFRPWENPAGGYYPASGESLHTAVQDHLSVSDTAIGVYPVFSSQSADSGSTVHCVWWGCVDWDQGDTDSWIHAKNTQRVLDQLDVPSWIERSRSKGYHLWVFFSETMFAIEIREGLIGACNVVDAPITEVNPKQIALGGKGIGNGVRLPYPHGYTQRNVVIEGSFDNPKILSAEEFTERAHSTRIDKDAWSPVRKLYVPPPDTNIPPIDINSALKSTVYLTGQAGLVRQKGPRYKEDKPGGDRSATLYHLACLMCRQGYEPNEVMSEIASADKDWGGKFATRPDGEERLRGLVESAIERIRQEKAQAW